MSKFRLYFVKRHAHTHARTQVRTHTHTLTLTLLFIPSDLPLESKPSSFFLID